MQSKYIYYVCTVCSVFSLSWFRLALIYLFLCVNGIYFEIRVNVFPLVYVCTPMQCYATRYPTVNSCVYKCCMLIGSLVTMAWGVFKLRVAETASKYGGYLRIN
jgi:hypothetical protein